MIIVRKKNALASLGSLLLGSLPLGSLLRSRTPRPAVVHVARTYIQPYAAARRPGAASARSACAARRAASHCSIYTTLAWNSSESVPRSGSLSFSDNRDTRAYSTRTSGSGRPRSVGARRCRGSRSIRPLASGYAPTHYTLHATAGSARTRTCLHFSLATLAPLP